MDNHLGQLLVQIESDRTKTAGVGFSKFSIKNSPKIEFLAKREEKHKPYGGPPGATSGAV